MISIRSRITATADATGPSRVLKNSSHRDFPIISVTEPPKSEGKTKSPSVGIKTRKHPAMLQVFYKGIVISQQAEIGETAIGQS